MPFLYINYVCNTAYTISQQVYLKKMLVWFCESENMKFCILTPYIYPNVFFNYSCKKQFGFNCNQQYFVWICVWVCASLPSDGAPYQSISTGVYCSHCQNVQENVIKQKTNNIHNFNEYSAACNITGDGFWFITFSRTCWQWLS